MSKEFQHVVFGSGPVGRSIAEALSARGETVRVVNRSGHLTEAPAGVEVTAGDLYDPAAVRALTQGAKVVYQAAQPRYFEWPQKFPPLQHAIIAGLSGGSAKLVLVENLYLYGAVNGVPMTEELPHAAHTRKGKTRAEMSAAAFAAHREGRLRVTAGRASDFFGPWALGSTMGERAFYPLLAGKPAQLTGRADLPHTHTYVGDFGRSLVLLGERDEADGQAWHVPNDRPRITQAEFIELAAQIAGVQPRFSAMGKLMMALGGLFIPEARESVEMMYEFDQPFVVDSGKFERTFGMSATPLEEALQATLDWFRAHPQAAH